ncbi:MAG: sulfotransferase [Xenococcaceae cyanobacterium]
MTNKTSDNPIFIVGMPRSGTTLMRSMLSVHPNLAVSRETHFFPKWWERYQKTDLNNLDNFEAFWQEFSDHNRFPKIVIDPTLIKAKILAADEINLKTIFNTMMEVLAATMNKPRWVEKTPDHYKYLDQILDWYPQAQIIWMLRDPRAVIASTLQRWPKTPVDVRAKEWSDSIVIFQDKWSENPRVKLIKYEDLVADAESQTIELCDFLGEEFYPAMIQERTQNVQQVFLPDEEPTKGPNRLANRAISAVGIDKWRSTLSPEDITTVEQITKDSMSLYNYPIQIFAKT